MKKRNKRKLTLKLLEYAADSVAKVKAWPSSRNSISHVSVMLSKVLASAVMDNTWDASSLDDWQYDDFAQTFSFEVHSVFRMGPEISSRPVQIKSRFHFDPKVDLLAELDRVSDEIKQYSDNLLFMQRAYHAAQKAGHVYALDSND
jgi:hypothetical protein